MADWNSSQIAFEDVPKREEDRNGRWSGVDVDTATMVSIVSSAIILFSGCVAVVCLIVYMKKTDSIRYRNCQPIPTATHALSVCAKCGATVALTPALESKLATPAVVRNTQSMDASNGDRRPQELRPTKTSPTTPVATERPPVMTSAGGTALYAISKSLETIEDKMAPNDSYLGIICGHIVGAQTTAYSMNCNDIHMKANDDIKRQALSCPSQCSSNHSELIRAYEFAQQSKQMRKQCHRLSFESVVDIYESIGGGSDRETPTDPGIREFTKSPPMPNEKRQGVVQHNNQIK